VQFLKSVIRLQLTIWLSYVNGRSARCGMIAIMLRPYGCTRVSPDVMT